MKITLLFCFLFLATLSFGQNQPPVANDDTLIFYYDEVHGPGNVEITMNQWQNNDYDVQGGTITTDTAFYNGINSITIFKPAGFVYWITYFAPNNFIGTDSIQYIIKDNGNPVMYDTAMIYIEIKPQLHAILDANNIAARVDKFSLFSNYPDGPGFEAPKGSGTHSIYSANLWAAGLNGTQVYSSVKGFFLRV